MIVDFVTRNWSWVKEDPLSYPVKKEVRNYVFSLLARRKFWNPEVADNISEEVLTIAAEKLFHKWDSIGPHQYGIFLVKTVQFQVKKFIKDYAIKCKKAGQLIADSQNRRDSCDTVSDNG